MASNSPAEPVRIERFSRLAWGIIAVLLLSVVYSVLQIGNVRPYLWPAGGGARLADDPAARMPLLARPVDVRTELDGEQAVRQVATGSPAARAGIAPGDTIAAIRSTDGPWSVALGESGRTPEGRLAAWRDLYWIGVSSPARWEVRDTLSGGTRTVTIEPEPVWRSEADGWASRHLGMIAQIVVFVGGAIVLFVLRSHDVTAGLCVLALALSGVAGGGPLFGAERDLPGGGLMTVFAWMASPFAFPVIALAILYFPARSPLLARLPWLHAVPLLAAAPMIVPSLASALYLTGVDAAKDTALWDATHPGVFYAAFATALGVNVLAVVEGTYRYQFNHDANDRRRIRMALYTTLPGVLAYVLKDGVPIVAALAGTPLPPYPPALFLFLHALVLLPAFGLVYAIGVARVLGPRVVLRRSLQYALANRTLSILTILPGVALILSLVLHRDRTISEIVRSSSGLFILLVIAAVAMWKYRERARQLLDQRFFREEYDARKILLSLASRVRFETDPADLATLVVSQLDEALHPQRAAVLVSGVDDGRLTSVATLHGTVPPLPLDGGLVSMLRWSDEPFEIYLTDPRSPARRLPAEERAWLEQTNTVLLVPVLNKDRMLIAAIALGERRSEEAYTAEDRQLLASVATQMGLGFDVARLRRRTEGAAADTGQIVAPTAATPPMMECPRCGRCEEFPLDICPADGSTMKPVPYVPRTIDNKYRLEQLLGRGGMGAVYRARDMRLDRLVAVKVVRAELLGDVEARRRFRREAQIIARLQHPSIVAVYDYGTFPDGGAYLVMELVRGEDLRRVLQREGRLDPQAAMRILSAVCDAIEAAHREGVLHRDLKPENILLPGGGIEAKVLDFGVAKVVTDELPRDGLPPSEAPTVLTTAAGMIIGTPAYMAPEQFRSTRVDTRTDVFSLGVVAYEMLSGELPFGRGSLGEVILAQARGAPPLRGVNIPPAAEQAIRTALDTDPDRRPSSPHAFAHLIASALGRG